MKQVKVMEKCVTLVTIPAHLPVIMWPQIGDYDSPYVLKTLPCEKKDGKYFNLRTGQEVKKADSMLEWTNLSGSYFRYPDGYELLLSKRFKDNKLLVFETDYQDGRKFHPESMLYRPIIEREEKKPL